MENTIELKNITRATGYEENLAEKVNELMTYAPWNDLQKENGEWVKDALANAIMVILVKVPSSPSRTRAINLIVDARMLANQAITFKGQI